MELYMAINFTDAQLNFGKVLILRFGHKLKLTEVKKLTNSKKVRLVKGGPIGDDIDSFLLFAIDSSMLALGLHNLMGADVYRIEGDQASTVMLAMKIGVSFKSVTLSAKDVKVLHNAYLTKQEIDTTRSSISNAVDKHNKLVNLLTKQKITSNLSKKSNAFAKVAKDYAEDELDKTVTKIQEIMKNSW